MTFFNKKTASVNQWWTVYEELNLCDGKIEFILDDDEDMIEMTYKDGMLIDVGKYSDSYYITVVSSNDEFGWRNPLAEIEVVNKKDLVNKIQATILEFRLVNDIIQ